MRVVRRVYGALTFPVVVSVSNHEQTAWSNDGVSLVNGRVVMVWNEISKYALIVVIVGAALVHALFPRDDWRPVESSGSVSIVVFDRWTGYFQRDVYDDKGDLNVMGVFTPF